jgi:hypothetical protein
MAESLATTMKQALQVVLILFVVCALVGIIPATEAYSATWYQYWGGVAAVAGIICAGFYVGRVLKKPVR